MQQKQAKQNKTIIDGASLLENLQCNKQTNKNRAKRDQRKQNKTKQRNKGNKSNLQLCAKYSISRYFQNDYGENCCNKSIRPHPAFLNLQLLCRKWFAENVLLKMICWKWLAENVLLKMSVYLMRMARQCNTTKIELIVIVCLCLCI